MYGLDFDDAAGGQAFGRAMDQELAEQVRCDLERRPAVEVALENQRIALTYGLSPSSKR